MLYAWVIDQVRRISNDARKQYQLEFNEHVDPLRWQVNFGLGIVSKLVDRLEQLRDKQRQDESTTALVIHHATEISDYLESIGRSRIDGRPTKAHTEWMAKYQAQEAADAELLKRDPTAYYLRYPWLHPDRVLAGQKKEDRKAARRANYVPRGYGRRGPAWTPERERQESQASSAHTHGRQSADRINLEPFLGGRTSDQSPAKLKGGRKRG
jgi:hypothetical protein